MLPLAVLIWLLVKTAAAGESHDELLRQAYAAFNNGNTEEAVALAAKAIETDPKKPNSYLFRGRVHAARRDGEKAIADYGEAIKLAPRDANAYQWRGCEHFRLGHIEQSIADFDKFIELRPDEEAQHWQRGISYYYARRYEDGRKQFELHRTVNPHDVENAAWHFLCAARATNLEKARAALIPIDVQQDGRVPMKQVYALFKGESSADDVLAAAKAGDPPPAHLKRNKFYAHLYVGLYHEASGKEALAREHILKAAESAGDDYMGDVARVHAALLKSKGADVK